jgi:hypothetical protein
MTGDQVVQLDDGTTTKNLAVGKVNWTPGGGHNHWHLMGFESYELRSVETPDTVSTDRKTGFCLIDAVFNQSCGLDHPEWTAVSMGLSVGGHDTYAAFLEGQDVELVPAVIPTGRYYLVHRANPSGALEEETLANNAASVLVNVGWPETGTGAPRVTWIRECPDAAVCPPQPGDPEPADYRVPQPQPQPDPQPDPEPEAAPETQQPQPTTGPPPQNVPVVAAPVIAAAQSARMTRVAALDLTRKAIGRATKNKAKQIRTACGRDSSSRFDCRVAWDQSGKRWRGFASVWYRVVSGRLRWYYSVEAAGPDGRGVKRGTKRGVLSSASASVGGPSMLCGPLPTI